MMENMNMVNENNVIPYGVTPEQALREMILDKIVTTLKEFDERLDTGNISLESSLSKIGLDSLDMYEIVMWLEDAYDINIENAHLCNDVSAMVEVIYQKLMDKPVYQAGRCASESLKEMFKLDAKTP